MGTSTKPTFVLVLGAFHTAAHGQILADALHAKGHPTEAISHPSVGSHAATAAPTADTLNLRQVLEELINEQQRDVVLFCHSYGGIPASQSVNGLERGARAKAGRKGGIVKVIYFSAILTREGESSQQARAAAGIIPGGWVDMDRDNRFLIANSEAAAILFHDLPDDQAEHWASKLEPMSTHISATPATNVCWDIDVPKVYIFSKKDRALSLKGQQRMLERVQGNRTGDWETYEMDCGHSPFLSHVEELTEILTKA